MSGFFGIASMKDCILPLFFGVDYHSHLGTKRGGLAVYGENGFKRKIHNIENSPFRTKFENDLEGLHGNIGIGIISDNESQPLIVNSKLGSFAICTVGRVDNLDELMQYCFNNGYTQFIEMNRGGINSTELVAALINQKENIVDGIVHAQNMIKGSMSIMVLLNDRIIAARDRVGRTPIIVGKKKDGYCLSFENSAFLNLGFKYLKDLGPGEIVEVFPNDINQLKEPGTEKKVCSFLWTYYGYPTSSYEGVNVETMRYKCGQLMYSYDEGIDIDSVAGIPDSGIAHAIGYANASNFPYSRPFIKYTPTWPRSFMPQAQNQRNLIAHMKLIPVHDLIKNKKLLLIDDSIVRGTQFRETVEFLFESGVKEVHARLACPPIMYGCKYLNFSRSTSDLDLIARRIIANLEGNDNPPKEIIDEYIDYKSDKHKAMVDEICRQMGFTSLKYYRIDDLIDSIGLKECELCTYCFNGKE